MPALPTSWLRTESTLFGSCSLTRHEAGMALMAWSSVAFCVSLMSSRRKTFSSTLPSHLPTTLDTMWPSTITPPSRNRLTATVEMAATVMKRFLFRLTTASPAKYLRRRPMLRVRSRWEPGASLGAVPVDATHLVPDHLAVLQFDDPLAELVHDGVVVGGHHDGGVGGVDAEEQLHDVRRGRGVEVAGGLVRQEDRRAVDHGPGHRDALLLAAGQFVGAVVDPVGQADQVEDLGDPLTDDVAGLADDLE